MRVLLQVWHFTRSVLLVERVGCSNRGVSTADAVAEEWEHQNREGARPNQCRCRLRKHDSVCGFQAGDGHQNWKGGGDVEGESAPLAGIWDHLSVEQELRQTSDG